MKQINFSPLSETYPLGQYMEMDSDMEVDRCTFPSPLN